MSDPYDDPGWRSLRGNLVLVVAPMLLPRALERGRLGSNPLLVLRLVFVTFVTTLLLIGGVVVLLTTVGGLAASGTMETPVVAAGVALLGVVNLLGQRLVERPLDCDELFGYYRTRFMLRMAMSNSCALIGFVGVILTGEAWVYLVGLAVAAVGLARAAPTSSNLARDQDALLGTGCGRSLLVELQRVE